MSFVLDGIQTAMAQRESGSEPGCDSTHTTVSCRCGWVVTWKHAGTFYADELSPPLDALRFHYTHCVQARIPDIDREASE